MMRRGVWLAAVLLLAGCGMGEPSGNSPEAVCRRQAYDDPKVKDLIVQSMGPGTDAPGLQYDYDMALRDATNACLRKMGVPLQGGVEPVRPR